ncbi:uncharacterized protein BDW47DRAFT_79999 [Aspergillus candidus]|uniref:Uncharacterized protein n=1 Tax=Aspergillus candidus TaxID=41067 RepID=A0A2I2F0L4_ASPCN|nr:hypothetical protein BDW47DRAFT_79999 [Aspergillus candidus]PLB34172.1 hypothetical protein BDW47DRAFT_79999 [Aspergillus candidus]
MKPTLPVLLLAAIATAAPIPENIPRAEGENLLGLIASMGGLHSLLTDSLSLGGHPLKEILGQDDDKGEGKGKGKEGAEEAPAAEAPPAAEGQEKGQEGQGAKSEESQGGKADQA